MAAYTETYSGLTHEQREYYENVLLEYAKSNLPHVMVAQKGRSISIPDHNGMTVQFR